MSEAVLHVDRNRLVAEAGELQGGVERRDPIGLYRCVAADQVPGCNVVDIVESGPAQRHADRRALAQRVIDAGQQLEPALLHRSG